MILSTVITLEALRKHGSFMSWALCCHGHDIVMQKKKKKGLKSSQDWWSCDLVFKFALNQWRICYRTTGVTFGIYSLTFFSFCLLLFSSLLYLSHLLNHKQHLPVFFIHSLFNTFAANKYPPPQPILTTLHPLPRLFGIHTFLIL